MRSQLSSATTKTILISRSKVLSEANLASRFFGEILLDINQLYKKSKELKTIDYIIIDIDTVSKEICPFLIETRILRFYKNLKFIYTSRQIKRFIRLLLKNENHLSDLIFEQGSYVTTNQLITSLKTKF